MPAILQSLLHDHELPFIAIAAGICAFGAIATINVSQRLTEGRRRPFWLLVVSVCSGATVWATHFVAMLAYRADVAMNFKPGLTAMSLVLGATLMGSGFLLAAIRSERTGFRLAGGAIVGAGVVALHYVGMSAVGVSGHFTWDTGLVTASIVMSLAFGALSLWVAFGSRWEKPTLIGAVLMVVMVVSLHFTAMGAVHLQLDGSHMDASGVSRDGLATAVTLVSLLVLIIGLASAIVDQKMVRQSTESMARIRASEARFRAIFDHAALGITVIDSSTGEITNANRAFRDLLGYEEAEVIGQVAATFSPAEDAGLTREPVRSLRLGLRDTVTVEKRFVRKDGQMIWGNLVVSRVEDVAADGSGALVGMVEDITVRKEMEAQLIHQAFHDSLTGLANRALFRDRVEHALARAASNWLRPGAPAQPENGIIVMFIDLDNFKNVNDSLGHGTGDRLLVEVGRRVARCVRGSDTVARLGGDEFAVLLEGTDDPAVVAERILSALRTPISLGNRRVVISASIGIARFWSGDDTDALLRSADAAMYAAKGNGRGRYALYDPDMHRQALERLQLEEDLRLAIERNGLELHYQPLVTLASGKLQGIEALLRWQHRTLGLISPSQFIPIAEETGLIIPLGYWVIEEACRQASEWLRRGEGIEESFNVAVNLSARQLQDENLEEKVAAALEAAGLAPERLVLEITESAIMEDVDAALARVSCLKKLGVGLAIDDFGTGYSSLSQLQKFPFDALKIDKSFIDAINRSVMEMTPAAAKDVALVRMIVALGRALGLRVVAEGIEEGLQGSLLLEYGCEVGQGFHYARPLTAGDFADEFLLKSVEEATAAA